MNREVSKFGLFHAASVFLCITCKKIILRIIVFIADLNRISIIVFTWILKNIFCQQSSEKGFE